jgi:type VI protein secretion system component Hcp
MNTDSKPQRFLFPALACVTLLASSLPASAANDYFLKFDGIDGSSVVKGHEKAIEFTSFNWGLSASRPQGPGSSVGKPVFEDFSWTQTLDVSVGGLFSSMATGKTIKNAVVDFVVAGEKPETYFRLTFDKVSLTYLDFSASGGSLVGLDGSFAYDKVTLDYWEQDKAGKFVKAGSAFYDLASGQGSIPAVAALFSKGLTGPQIAAVPEPESYAMLLAGLGLLGVIARRRRTTV